MDHHTDISNSSNSSSIDNSNNIDNNNNNNNIHNTSTTTNIAGENDKSDTGNGNQPTGDESHDLMDQEEEEEEEEEGGDERPAIPQYLPNNGSVKNPLAAAISSAPPSPASAMTMAPLTLATTTTTTTTARPHSHLGPPPPLFASQLRSAVSFSSSLPSSLDRSPPNRSWPSVSPPARPGQSHRPDDPPATLPSWTRTPPKRDADPAQAKGLDPARHPACRRCRHLGADVRIVGCPSGCAFHARCLDLVAVCRRFSSPVVDGAGDDKVRLRTCPGCGRPAEGLEIVPLSFAEMDRARSALIEMRQGQGGSQGQKQGQEGEREREEGAKEGAEKGGDAGNSHSTANSSRNGNHKRTRPQTATTDSSIPPYDPAAPRTGRWTDPELSFRDALLPPFLSGSLPLPNNLKLVDFLSSVLKSKPSRLTKKMKHARLSAKHYFVHSGFLRADDEAETLSRLEMEFLNSIPEEKEREEMRFHMQKEWRDHFAERCEYLRLEVDVRRWWKSVEEVEKRVQAEKEKRRREKRRFMMGKVLEGDVVESCGVGGIFVDGFGGGRVGGGGVGASDSSNGAATSRQPLVPDQNATNTPMGHGDNHRHNNNNGNTTATQHPHEGDPMEFDYDLVASALGSHPHHEGDDNVDFNKLYQSIVGDGDPHPHPHHDGHPHLLQSPPMNGLHDPIPNNNNNQSHHNHNQNNNSQRLHSTINHQHQNPSSTSLDSTHSSAASSDSPLLHAKYHHHHPHGIDDDRPPFFNSATQPNFQFAAPFLSILTSYIEQRRVPFEHVDLWVPSFSPHWNPKEPTAPLTSSLGSGSLAQGNGGGMGGDGAACRLCFAGSATVGVHLVEAKDDDGTERVVDGDASKNNTNEKDNDENDRQHKYHRMKCLPLSEDQIFNYSLFGSYSEKFSFSSGCGLPGRVYQSGIPAWEQFVMNAPPHLFERRGGAMQSGINTALGLPIGSRTGNANSSVGRMVVVLYSRHNREKDEELVDRLMRDMRMVSPCPRWKLVVDVLPEHWNGDGNGTNGSGACASPGNLNGFVPDDGRCGGLSPPMGVFALNGHPSPRQQPPQPLQQNVIGNGGSGMGHPGVSSIPLSQQGGQQQQHPQPNSPQDPTKETKIQQLITLLGENMPSDPTSPLGQQLHSIMSLRLVLLRPSANRTPQEEHTIDTILLLMDSYVAANRDRSDIVLFLARDFAFHSMQMQQQAQHAVSGVGFLQMQQQQQQQQVQGRGILSPHHLSSHLQQQQQQQQAQFAMAQAPNFGQMKSNVQGNSTQHQQQQQQQQQQLQLQNHHQQLQQQHMTLQKQALTTPTFGPFRG